MLFMSYYCTNQQQLTTYEIMKWNFQQQQQQQQQQQPKKLIHLIDWSSIFKYYFKYVVFVLFLLLSNQLILNMGQSMKS